MEFLQKTILQILSNVPQLNLQTDEKIYFLIENVFKECNYSVLSKILNSNPLSITFTILSIFQLLPVCYYNLKSPTHRIQPSNEKVLKSQTGIYRKYLSIKRKWGALTSVQKEILEKCNLANKLKKTFFVAIFHLSL